MYGSCSLCFVCFFQAEDGIRDLTVTGVQTCALPISPLLPPTPSAPGPLHRPPAPTPRSRAGGRERDGDRFGLRRPPPARRARGAPPGSWLLLAAGHAQGDPLPLLAVRSGGQPIAGQRCHCLLGLIGEDA